MNYENICEICFQEFNENTITLNCNHKFHKLCFKFSIDNQKKLECPYCRTRVDLNVIRNIQKCNAIIKSGKNKGNKCSNSCKFNLYCGVHKKYNKD